jgi:hypothetical protein
MRAKKELKENNVGHVRLAQEAISDFVRDYHLLQCACFMCKQIVHKIERRQELTHADHYHMSVCMPVLQELRKKRDEKECFSEGKR